MKINRKLKIALVSILGTFLLLFAVLVVHIALVTKNTKYDHPSIQLARIDFKEPIDSLKAKQINRDIKAIAGVGNTHFNTKAGILIYSMDVNKNSNDKVFKELMSKTTYKAKPFVVTEAMAANGCPVMDKTTFTYKFSNVINKIIN